VSVVFVIVVALWLVAFAVNLVHWHGSGCLYYEAASAGSRILQLGIGAAAFIFCILAPQNILSASVAIMDIFFALLVIQHIGMILRRRRDREQGIEILSAFYEG